MSDPSIDPAATSAGAATALAAGEWTLDPDNSHAEFAVKHFWGLVTVRGHFNEIAGELSIDPAGAVAGELRIDAASVDTGNKQRDKHLRSADFFDAEQHPLVVLDITGATPADGGEIAMRGTLQAAGRSQPVSFTARAEEAGPDAVTLRAELVVDRSAFGMTWSPLGMAAKEAAGSVVARFVRS